MNPEPQDETPKSIELPTPTAWPLMAAFGITFVFAGLITNIFVSIIGLVCALAGAVGWFRDVFPHPKEEPFPVRPQDQHARPPATSARTVQHLRPGVAGHRVRIPVEMTPYSAGIIGGLAGGAAMAVLAVVYGLVAEGSIWYPINLLAAAAMPSMAAADLETLKAFSFTALIVASVIHLIFSTMVGLLYTVMLPMLPAKLEWFWGGIVAPLVWTAVLFPLMDIMDPALADRVPWLWFVLCQIAFGLVGGFVIFKSARIETMQTWPLASKMGVEAQEEEQS